MNVEPGERRGEDPRPLLSVVLATLNERANLPVLFDRLGSLDLPSMELLVVDDGSTDGTREYVAEHAAVDARIRLLVHEGKQTTLRAQCQAIDRARGKYLVVMDADLQHPPETILRILRGLEEGASLVVASRYSPGGSPGPRAPVRFVLSRGAEWLAKLFLPPARPLSDPVSGFFGFRRALWRPLDPRYRGYKLLLFVLVMADRQRVSEVGFRFEPRASGASKLTQSLAFVRIFLVELFHARQLMASLQRASSGGGLPAASPIPPRS